MLQDPQRLTALEQSGLQKNIPVEGIEALDRLAALVAKLLRVPLALVSLVEEERQAFPGMHGTLPAPFHQRQTPISHSFCQHVVNTGEPLVIHDARRDERVSGNPAIRDLNVAAYLGTPLTTAEGYVLGSLCAIDTAPRTWTDAETDTLRGLADFAIADLAARRGEARLQEADRLLAVKTRSDLDQLGEIFKRSPSFMAILRGPRHVFERVNDRYYQLVGHRDILGKPVSEGLPEIAGQGFLELLDEVYATGEPFVGNDMLFKVRSGPGDLIQERFVDLVYLPTRDADGTINGIFAHGVDLTERKTTEKTLAQLAEQRRLALESAQMGWWHLDLLDNHRVHWDERFKVIFGVREGDLAYEKVVSLLHPDDRERVNAAVQAAMRPHDPEPFSTEYRVVHHDGSLHWVATRGRAAFEGEGENRRAISFVGTVKDITEAKAAQDALHESEARFRQLADAMPQIVYAGGVDGHMDYYNKQWYDYTGLPRGATGSEGWDALLHPDDFQGVMDVWSAALRSGKLYEKEFRLKGASDGTYRWFLSRALPIKDASGNVARWFGTNTDIHDYKQLHAQNEQLLTSERAARSEAERTSRMKDEFLATLSHELRTPLNAILGWTQVLRGDPANTGDVESGLATIERNARAQNQIIEDLLDMSAIISGKVRLDVQPLDLDQVVRSSVETMRPAADAKGIRLQALIDPEARMINGDPNRLQQVFWNLLTNAIKFTPKGGRVQVLLERIHSHLEVSIGDSGEGIAREFLPYVFDRFRQQDASTTRRHGGLGLGLAIVKQLVELHGGSVHADSAGLGHGTTFRVMLPLWVVRSRYDSPAEEPRHPHASSHPALSVPTEVLKLAGVKALVVDDEADARALIKRLLEDRGALVHTAGSVEEALPLLMAERPDVLVSDIGMPGEDGYALIRRVRALPPEQGGTIPAVALTAYARSEDRLKVILAGFQMHLAKPVEAAELLAQVASLTGRMTHF